MYLLAGVCVCVSVSENGDSHVSCWTRYFMIGSLSPERDIGGHSFFPSFAG